MPTSIKMARQLQIREALREAMNEEMRRDESIILMGEEVAEYNGAYKVSQGMLDEFGEKRIIDTPIAELGFAGIATGAAMNGLKPIVEFMTFNFSLVAIDQVINAAAKMNSMSGGEFTCPMVFRGPTGSAGQLGAQHSQAFESWYANTPGLKVAVISNSYNAKGLLKSAIVDPDPVLIMESEQMYGLKFDVPEEEYYIPLGQANIQKSGTDVTLVSFGKMMRVAEEAVKALSEKGIDIELIDLQSVRPIDYDTIAQSIKKTNRCVVLEEAWPLASISSEISYMMSQMVFDHLDAPIKRVTTRDTPLPYAITLVDAWLPNAQRVVEAVESVLYA